MARIYTRTGDAGETGLFDGTRVSKSDPRVEAYGEVDELSAWLGLVRSHLTDSDLLDMIERLQRDLFALGAILADPRHRIAARVEKAVVSAEAVSELEGWIDALEREVPPLRRFILAGGSGAGAELQLARAVCRRAERAIVRLGPAAVDAVAITYINRLSDLLFTMARVANHRAGAPEIEW